MVIAKPPHDRIPRNTVGPADGAKAQSCTAKLGHFLDLAFIDLTRGAENFSCGYGLFKALHYQATVARVGERTQLFREWSAAVEAVIVREEEPRGLQLNMFGDLGVSSVQNW